MKKQGLLDADVVLGFIVARGQHGKAVEGLAKAIERLQ